MTELLCLANGMSPPLLTNPQSLTLERLPPLLPPPLQVWAEMLQKEAHASETLVAAVVASLFVATGLEVAWLRVVFLRLHQRVVELLSARVTPGVLGDGRFHRGSKPRSPCLAVYPKVTWNEAAWRSAAASLRSQRQQTQV